MSDCIIGIDISKQHLDLHRLPDGATRRVSNSSAGLRDLIRWIGKRTVTRIVFEATGAYHRTLEQTLGKAGLLLCKVNPRQARRFAEAMALNAKTDAVDAAMLARLGSALALEIRPAPSELLRSLARVAVCTARPDQGSDRHQKPKRYPDDCHAQATQQTAPGSN